MKRLPALALLLLASACDFSAAVDSYCARHPELCADGGSDAAIPDAGMPGDGGSAADSGTPPDGGSILDAGAAADAGTRTDAGSGAPDAGAVDAGTPQCVPTCTYDGGALPPHMVYTCIADDVCGLACAPLWGDCDQDAGDGCEKPLAQDTANCGACGHVCGNRNAASASCTNGACVITCDPNYANCDGQDFNGCEVSLWGDDHNCGACGYACGGPGQCAPPGVCKLTADAESINPPAYPFPGLVQDAMDLYWTNSSAVRTVQKDGGGLSTVCTAADVGGAVGPGLLAVDAQSIYVWGNTFSADFWTGSKQGVAQGGPFTHLANPPYQAPSGLYLDSAPTGTAQAVIWPERFSNQGVWRYTPSDGGLVALARASAPQGDVIGSTREGNDLVWVYSNLDVQSVDLTLPGAPPVDDGQIPSANGTRLLAVTANGSPLDGGAIYALMWGDGGFGGTLVALTASGTAQVASCPTSGFGADMATDGVNVYVAAGSLYKIPLAGGPCAPWVDRNQLVGTPLIQEVSVDDAAVYFTTGTNVFRVRK